MPTAATAAVGVGSYRGEVAAATASDCSPRRFTLRYAVVVPMSCSRAAASGTTSTPKRSPRRRPNPGRSGATEQFLASRGTGNAGQSGRDLTRTLAEVEAIGRIAAPIRARERELPDDHRVQRLGRRTSRRETARSSPPTARRWDSSVFRRPDQGHRASPMVPTAVAAAHRGHRPGALPPWASSEWDPTTLARRKAGSMNTARCTKGPGPKTRSKKKN